MYFLRFCGNLQPAKVFLSKAQNNIGTAGLRSFKSAAPKLLQNQSQTFSPFIVKCSIFGVSGYLSLRYVDFKGLLPTAHCRDVHEDVSQFQLKEENDGADVKTKQSVDSFPIRQFLQ